MVNCSACGAENSDNTQFCVKCGAALAAKEARPPSSPEWTPTGGAGAYSQPQSPMPYPQQPGQGEPPHPALAAVVSLFFPGMGLLFVPNKQTMGILIFGGTIVGWVILLVLYFAFTAITLGFGSIVGCCFLLAPLWNLATAIHSYDEAAKVSNGKFAPLIFKK